MALTEAEMALEEGEIPIGAVLVCQDRLIAKAHNLTETLCDVTAHAEMQVFTSASSMLGSKYLKDCTLYVTLQPCPMCAGAAYWTQLSRVVYGAEDLKHAHIDRKPLYHPKTRVEGGVLKEESAALLQHFFQEKRPDRKEGRGAGRTHATGNADREVVTNGQTKIH